MNTMTYWMECLASAVLAAAVTTVLATAINVGFPALPGSVAGQPAAALEGMAA